MNAKVTMDRLMLRLPETWRGRETRLVRLIGRELGQLPFAGSIERTALALPPMLAREGESDLSLARRIAGAIHRELTAEPGAGSSAANTWERGEHA